jgi:transcriptional regulator with XRE-family HTH domain
MPSVENTDFFSVCYATVPASWDMLENGEEVRLDEREEELRQLGLRVRKLRRRQKLTTRELAARAGLSPSLVNSVELGNTSASVSSLRRLASGLGVPLAELFLEGPSDGARSTHREAASTFTQDGRPDSGPGAVAIVRKSQRKRLHFPEGHLMYELLTPNLRWGIEFLLVQLEPGHPPVESMAHAGQECALVLEGTMHVVVGDDVYLLEKGDSISLDSSVPHRIENRGTTTLIQISAITPPSL